MKYKETVEQPQEATIEQESPVKDSGEKDLRKTFVEIIKRRISLIKDSIQEIEYAFKELGEIDEADN